MNTIGIFVWNIIMVYLGVAASTSWENVLLCTVIYTKIIVSVLGSIAVVIAFLFIKKRVVKK